MSDEVGVIPEFFGSNSLLTEKFLSNVPDNSRIIVFKGALRKDCYIIVEDGNTKRQRAFSKQYTFNECIKELETSDMSLSVVKRVGALRIEKNKPSRDKINDMIRKLWEQMEEER